MKMKKRSSVAWEMNKNLNLNLTRRIALPVKKRINITTKKLLAMMKIRRKMKKSQIGMLNSLRKTGLNMTTIILASSTSTKVNSSSSNFQMKY
jgi:hypothetical protein